MELNQEPDLKLLPLAGRSAGQDKGLNQTWEGGDGGPRERQSVPLSVSRIWLVGILGGAEHKGRNAGALLSAEMTGLSCSCKEPCRELRLKGRPNVGWQSWVREIKIGRNCGRWNGGGSKDPKATKPRVGSIQKR